MWVNLLKAYLLYRNIFFVAFSCPGTAPASLASFTDTSETNWTRSSYTYNATKTNPILMFGVDGSNEMYIMLDDVSVVDKNDSSTQLLINPSFALSSTSLAGWSMWCSGGCNAGYGGTVINSSSCRTDNCYKSHCNNGGTDYLVQSFIAIIGHSYNISFWYQRGRDLSGGSAKLYVAIF